MRIRWTQPATRDFSQICDYLSEHGSPGTARRVALSIFDGVTSLSQFPQQGQRGRKSGTRELILTGLPYLAVYRIGNEVVEVLRILHGSQNWQ